MATLDIKDTFGFVEFVQIADKGALSKYFKPLPSGITVSTLDLKSQGGGALEKITSTEVGLDFGTTVQIGTANSVDLEIKPKASSTISIFAPVAGKTVSLFNPDQFAEPVPVAPNQRYIAATFDATVEADASGKATSDLKFGFKGNSDIKLSYYQRFDVSQNQNPGITLAEALKDTIANFAIPGDLDDVAAMQPYSIAAVDGTGSLKFSGTVSLTAMTNAPVSATLTSVGPVQVTAGGKASVGAGFEVSGEYQVRVERLPGSLFSLGLYRKKGTEFSLTASASGGFSAGLGQNDLFGKILEAISKNAKADKEALAGLPADQVAKVQSVIKQVADRTLNIGVSGEVGVGSDKEAMFLYEIDLDAITDQGRPLVHAALEGDLSPLVSWDTELPPKPMPAGITVKKALIAHDKTLRHTLKVNLLGIYNFEQVSQLMLKGATAWDATTGELVLTDTATASLIGVSTLNFAVDSRKLRHLLAEQFLISAAYKASGAVSEPALHAQHSYFDHTLNVSRRQLRNGLLLGAAFKLISDQQTALDELPAGIEDFGAASIVAETDYDDPAVEALFLASNQPPFPKRGPADYESAGRDAIKYLVQKGDEDDYRLYTATEGKLWEGMTQIGNVGSPQFAQLVRNYTQVAIAPSVIGVDYLNIVWWRDAMQACADALIKVRIFLSRHPNIDRNNHDFLAVRKQLANKLLAVVGKTRKDFGGPWGLIAMGLLATRVASVVPTLAITNRYVSLALEKAAAVGAASGALI
jgi:hypothetical protein